MQPRDFLNEDVKPESRKEYEGRDFLQESSRKSPNAKSFLSSSAKNANKALIDIVPEAKNPYAWPKAGLEAGGLAASVVQPEIGLLAKLAPNAPKIINSLTRIGAQTGYGAAQSPENPAFGGGIGGGASILSQLAASKNPLIGALLRGGLGAGAGYLTNALTGIGTPLSSAGTGAAAGIAFPKAAKLFAAKNPGLETLSHLKEAEVKPALEASRRLGTSITPAEASGNEYVGGLEGRYGRTGEAAAEKTRIGLERVEKQKTAIDDFLNTIYDKSTPQASLASKNRIQELYRQANKWKLKPEIVEEFKQDPIIDAAFKQVKSDPVYQRKLKGVDENSYVYLNQVKRAIDDMAGSAVKSGEKVRASEFTNAKNDLTDIMDKSVPVYKKAREEAQKSIIRSKIQKSLNKNEIKGSSFFNTVLRNENKFQELYDSLKNVPEAQSQLKDMKLAWKNLINIGKPGNKAAREESGINQSRQLINKMVDIWHEISGAKSNKDALKFIHSGKWDEGFKKIMDINDAAERTKQLNSLITRLIGAGTIAESEKK